MEAVVWCLKRMSHTQRKWDLVKTNGDKEITLDVVVVCFYFPQHIHFEKNLWEIMELVE